MKSIYYTIIAVVMVLISSVLYAAGEDLFTKKLTQDRVTYFPVPADNINYIFMQSIGNDTSIVIGDFTGVDKMIIMITDKNNDNTIDSVIEYFPLTKDLRKRTESQSRFFTKDLAKLKKDIIEGTVYKGNYTDDMKSLKVLESILSNPDSNSVYADVYGFNVKFFEVDERKKSSAVFTYGKNSSGYYLQFQTLYYRKDYKTEKKPMLKYSVFCKDTNDPVVKETVENLFKVKQPSASFSKGVKETK
jgi:hypothetical protein